MYINFSNETEKLMYTLFELLYAYTNQYRTDWKYFASSKFKAGKFSVFCLV